MEDDASSLARLFARAVRRAIVADEHHRGVFERAPDDTADGAGIVEDGNDHAGAGLIARELGPIALELGFGWNHLR
jgi:hypothetical protein